MVLGPQSADRLMPMFDYSFSNRLIIKQKQGHICFSNNVVIVLILCNQINSVDKSATCSWWLQSPRSRYILRGTNELAVHHTFTDDTIQ